MHCIAQLNEDILDILPYLNKMLGGAQFYTDPPTVMFFHYGKSIKVGAKEIAINALVDEAEAKRFISWLEDEINEVWEKREGITPKFIRRKNPQTIEILRLLPKTNCKRCGRDTCMLFAVQMAEGGLGHEHCPEPSDTNWHKLNLYLSRFDL